MGYLKNIKLFPIYKMFSYDILFYYAISMLYLTMVKGLSNSQVLLMGSIFCIFNMVLQIPTTIITDKIGYKKSMIIGNILITLWGIIYIIAPSFIFLVFADFLCAIAFGLKGGSEFPYLFKILKIENMQSETTRIEGKGSALYFIFEAIACLISGLLFKTNPYLPIIFATLCALIATFISFKFNDLVKINSGETTQNYFSDLKNGFKFIFNSSRLKSMLLFSGIFYAVLVVGAMFSKVFLVGLKVPSIYFGVIFASMNIIAALGSRLQRRLEKITKNKTLTYISLIFISSFILLGVAYLFNISNKHLIILGVIMFGIQAFLKGGYRIIIKNYLNNFTSSAIRTKIFSIYYAIEYLGASIALFIASKTLEITNVGLAFILFGIVFFILMLLCINTMKSRCGLKMEDYCEKDIKYTP